MTTVVLTKNPIYVDVIGTVAATTFPLRIKKILLCPIAAAASVADLSYLDGTAFATLKTADIRSTEIDFGYDGFLVPSLTVGTLTNGILYIYL